LRGVVPARILFFMIRPLPPALRGVALLQATLLLAVQLVDGSALHRCPAHDAVAPVAAEHAGHAARGHHDGQGHEQEQHVCTCLGSCHSGLAAFSAASSPRSATPVGVSASLAVDAGRPALSRPHHLLPFALPPPAIA
jgi:hypothetical protein